MITIVNYGMGNLASVKNALTYIGADASIESNPDKIAHASALILPGVGSFSRAMNFITSSGLHDAIRHATLTRATPLLGICLGMQLLADLGTEDGVCNGLGLIPGTVERLVPGKGLKIPHIGFNEVQQTSPSPLWKDVENSSDYYFIHSYQFKTTNEENCIGQTTYGTMIQCAIQKDHIFGVQFHPEKSQNNGLQLLRNFKKITQ